MAGGHSRHTLRPIRAAAPSSMTGGHPFPLWRALGFPPRGGTAPCASSTQWAAVVSRLRAAMPPGVKLPRLRSWPALWALVHATAPPAHTTWAQLCGRASVDTIVARLEGGNAAPPFSCYSWNARWVKASTPKAALKRQFVLDRVLAGHVVCVQETHWSEAQGFAWAGLFPATQVAFAHAHTDPLGVTRGGVAILVPHRARIVSQRILVPGSAVECCVDYGEEGTRTFWSVYLPPGSQGVTLGALWEARPPPGSALVVAGDFNVELVQPRTEEESALRERLFSWFGKLGVSPVPGSGHTRRGRKGQACIDAIAIDEAQAWRWSVAKAWRGDLSDHARLQIVAGARTSVGRSCTPAAMRSLPSAALVELRRVLLHVELALGGRGGRPPQRGGGNGAIEAPVQPGDLPGSHPARGIACEGSCRPPCPACAVEGGGARCGRDFCEPPSDRRRARGTLRAAAGSAGPRTLGQATANFGGRDGGPTRPRAGTGAGEGGPHPRSDEPSAPGREDLDVRRHGWNPVRALFIGPYINNAIKGWWRRNKSGTSDRCAVSEELRRIAGGGARVTVSAALKHWMAEHGDDSIALDPLQAARWLGCAEHARRCSRTAEAPLGSRGPAARRPSVAERYRVGRAVHKAFNRMQGLRGDDGHIVRDPAQVDQMLWDSRRGLWGSAPPVPGYADTILQTYFRDRAVELPDAPDPRPTDVAEKLLGAGGSAPGYDGIPYEAYHQGVELVTEALTLAVLAAHHDPAILDVMLGPNVDLLLWIPKKAGADRPDGQRPLQLPTCFRRLFGSVLTAMIAPAVEPKFSEWQASVKGGSCARNISSAFEHLAGYDEPVHAPRGALWRGVLGEATEGVEAACARADEPGLRRCPGVVLADQSKAFERLGMVWLRKVMDGWKFPRWVREAFDSLLKARGVRACIGGVLGCVRALARGLGMGNTPSPFLWCLAYDPIIFAVHEATGVRPPTYVDDLSALVWGPGQALAVEVFIMAAGLAAGLRVDAHTCTTFHASSGIGAAKAILGAMPVAVHAVGRDGGFRVTGVPGALTRTLLEAKLGAGWAAGCRIEHHPCRCIVKTQVIPGSRVEEWARALSESPFGANSAVDHGPYLGACLHCRAHGALGATEGGEWQASAAEGARHATWTRATGMITRRATESDQAVGSHAQKASEWNVYAISTTYYPAQIAEPTSEHRGAIRRAARVMVGSGRAIPLEFLHAAGVLGGARGYPRCSDAAISAAGVIVEIGGGAWGPPCLTPHVRKRIEDLRAWAAVPGDGPPEWPEWARGDQRVKDRVGELLRKWNAGNLGRAELARSGGDIYAALWRAGLGGGGGSRRTVSAMVDKARARRWFPTSGDEWGFARYASSFNAVFHVGKILCGGTAPGVALRARSARARFPRRCDACGDPRVAWSWVTGGPGLPGVAWCGGCLGGIEHLSPWAWVLGETYAGDGDLGEAVRAAPRAPACMAEGRWRGMRSFYGACPLCSMGEHGSEHLAIWCPAVAAAWIRLGAAHGPSPLRALSGDREAATCATRILHQASFIASSIHNKSAVEWREGADWIVRAVCAPDAAAEWNDDGLGTEAGSEAAPGGRVHFWEDAAGGGCWECDEWAGVCCPSSTRPGPPGRDGGPPAAPDRTVAAATGDVDDGQTIVTLCAAGVPAAWLAPGEHWWPPPRVVHPWEANAKWQVSGCGRCGRTRASLVAAAPIRRGDELRTHTGYPGQVRLPGEATLHLSMDGSAKGRTAGAGAVLWAREDLGRWRRVAEASIGIAGKTSPTCAEAWGLSAAADLLLAYGGTGRRVHVCGDCLMVVRFCAEQGRMRECGAQRIAERALARIAGAGWSCAWAVIPRKHNSAADSVAKRARRQAAAMRGQAPRPHAHRARVKWLESDLAAPPAQPQDNPVALGAQRPTRRCEPEAPRRGPSPC